ncbi:acetylxylan esterase [Microbacterium sp. ZXX196]|uniref:acetylxylan esterase n=1 Tax=Microbacterium sp. ZXX196 TaxID=2609291 RepID=UPI0012B941B9|nr:acetylxylan esterase [Microbacterium sp. ZXX196]MTE23583.1 acetylxylan esterase [Microbacterium sp. ZXX196]
MPHFDLPLAALREHRSTVQAPDDFAEFWASTLEGARAAGGETYARPVDNGLALVETHDVTFAGFAGDPISAWLHVPAGREPAGVVVEFLGYSGGRGYAHQQSEWVLAGYAHLLVDTRGQGYAHGKPGATADPHGSDPAAPGHLTRGISSPETHYYRRVFTDAARAVDVAHELMPGLPVVVAGISQGGGIAIAAAALGEGVAAALVDVPFLCDFPRATSITDRAPYAEIVTYLAAHRDRVDDVFRTLSYVDGVNLARLADVPALFSVGLMDATCPPSTVFGAYDAWAGADKDIAVYPYNDHEGGGPLHRRVQLDWLRDRLSA